MNALTALMLVAVAATSAPAEAPELAAARRLALGLELAGARAAYAAFADAQPGHPDALAALDEAAAIAEALGDPAGAATLLLTAVERGPRAPSAGRRWLRAGALFEAAGYVPAAVRVYEDRPSGKTPFRPDRPERVAAEVALGRLALGAGRTEEGVETLGAARLASERAKLPGLAAEAVVWLARDAVAHLEWSSLDPDGERLRPELGRRVEALGAAHKLLERVVEYGDPRWTCEALVDYGDVTARFARWLDDSPPPSGLRDEALEAYRGAMDGLTYPLHEKARAAYEKAAALVAERHLAAACGARARAGMRASDPPSPVPAWERLHSEVPASAGNAALDRPRARLAETPGDPEALLDAAAAFTETGHPEVARYVLTALAPGSPRQRALLARALRRLGDADAAWPYVEAVEADAPPDLLAERGMVLLAFGDLAGAAATFERLVAAHPTARTGEVERALRELEAERPGVDTD